MEIVVAKVVTMVILGTASMVAGLLPSLLVGQIWFQPRELFRSTSTAISLLSCFGGGVFLATCLLHLVPDVRSSVDIALTAAGIETGFPVADFIVSIGLFIILIVEQTALTFKHRTDELPHEHEHDHNDESRPLLKNVRSDNVSQVASQHSNSVKSESHVQASQGKGDPLEDGVAVVGHEAVTPCSERNMSDHRPTLSQSHETIDDDDCHDLHSPSKLRSILLLGALSLHSVFEGLAMGIQETTHGVWTLFIAVVIHKSVLAFSLGVNFLKSDMGLRATVRSLLVFSLMAPIGITIGIVITQEFSKTFSQSIANGIIQGLAAGTFLYITFFEVLPHEMNTTRDRLLKVLAIVLGFSVICTLVLLFPE